MQRQRLASVVLASITTMALFGSTNSMADCVDVKGKILNTLHNPAVGSLYFDGVGNVGGANTVGVVSLHADKPIGNMKCALLGVAVAPGNPDTGELPHFEHTISCDDEVQEDDKVQEDHKVQEGVHSQLKFATSGYVTGVGSECIAFFVENSEPVADTGRGAFLGVTGGQLTIEGTINNCTGSVDMKFTGEVCK